MLHDFTISPASGFPYFLGKYGSGGALSAGTHMSSDISLQNHFLDHPRRHMVGHVCPAHADDGPGVPAYMLAGIQGVF